MSKSNTDALNGAWRILRDQIADVLDVYVDHAMSRRDAVHLLRGQIEATIKQWEDGTFKRLEEIHVR